MALISYSISSISYSISYSIISVSLCWFGQKLNPSNQGVITPCSNSINSVIKGWERISAMVAGIHLFYRPHTWINVFIYAKIKLTKLFL